MGLADKAKNLANKAKKYSDSNEKQVDGGIDKAADFITSKTSGGTDSKVRSAAEKAKGMTGDNKPDRTPDAGPAPTRATPEPKK
jgi:hypothetical protein